MKKIILIFTLLILLTSCFGKEENEKVVNKKVEEKQTIKSFENPENYLEILINELENKKNSKDKVKLAETYLKYGNDYFKEDIFANKALKILNNLQSEFMVDYLKGYAYEIKRNYDEALKYYNEALKHNNLTNEQKGKVINQKGHVYDLMGKLEDANKYYIEAEKINPEDEKILLNRGRYEIRKWKYDIAKSYFEKVLNKTKDKFIKAEMYYNLSIIYQRKFDGLDKAIEYAKLGIKTDKDYPNNYLALGSLYITKGGDYLDKAPNQLKKSIELYPNNSVAYRYLGVYYYTKDDFDNAIKYFKKQVEISGTDILLMANDKKEIKLSGEYDLARTYALKLDMVNTLKYLKKVLDGRKTLFYTMFLIDFSSKDGPYSKFIGNKQFDTEIKNILLQYNKK